MLSLVSVKRISSDIPACNFDPNGLEIAGELSLVIGGFIISPAVVRDSSGYKIISGHFQYHVAVLAGRLNPKAGETIPAIVLEAKNQTMVEPKIKILKYRAAYTPQPPPRDRTYFYPSAIVNSRPMVP
jgi:hypothetical protein